MQATLPSRRPSRQYRPVGVPARITPDLAHFIEAQTSIFLATANAEGQPYIQHRGGPPGFLKVLDDKTLGLADFAGNRQYITQGNLMDNPKAHLFLIDYAQRQRIKIWGEARRGQRRADGKAYTRRLQGTPRTANPIHRCCLGCQLSAAHPTALRGCHVAAALAERDKRIEALEGEIARQADILHEAVGGEPAAKARSRSWCEELAASICFPHRLR